MGGGVHRWADRVEERNRLDEFDTSRSRKLPPRAFRKLVKDLRARLDEFRGVSNYELRELLFSYDSWRSEAETRDVFYREVYFWPAAPLFHLWLYSFTLLLTLQVCSSNSLSRTFLAQRAPDKSANSVNSSWVVKTAGWTHCQGRANELAAGIFIAVRGVKNVREQEIETRPG